MHRAIFFLLRNLCFSLRKIWLKKEKYCMNSLYLFSRFPLGTGLSGRVLCRVTPTRTTNIWAAVWPLARNRGVCKKQKKIKIKTKISSFLKKKIIKNSGIVLQANPTLYSAFWGHDFQNFIFGAQINTRSAALLRNNWCKRVKLERM